MAVGTALALAAGLGAAGNIAGGIIGGNAAEEGAEQAQRAYQAALEGFQRIGIPPVEAQRLALQLPEVQGALRPEMEQEIKADPSKMEGLSTDPRLKAAQMAALEKMQSLGTAKLTPEEETALNKIKRGVAREAQGRQESILQQKAMRGMGGSGDELAAQLSASQAAAERGAQEGEDVRAQASKRALEAILGAGKMGGDIRGQEFGEQSDIAKAQDLMNKFNTEQAIARQRQNIGTLNEAQLRNLQERQRVSEERGRLLNAQQQYNKELLQRQFENQMDKQRAVAGALGGTASASQAKGQAQAQKWGSIGQGIGQLGAGLAGGMKGSVPNLNDASTIAKNSLDPNDANTPLVYAPSYYKGTRR